MFKKQRDAEYAINHTIKVKKNLEYGNPYSTNNPVPSNKLLGTKKRCQRSL